MMPGVNYLIYSCFSARTTPGVSYRSLTLKESIVAVIDDLRYFHFSRMRTACQTINNIFLLISGDQACVVNVR